MSTKKGKRQMGNKVFPVPESVSIALKIQLDRFLSDEKETELKFPTFLSAQERGFIHARVAQLGLKSKSRGKGVNRFITIYKRAGSSIVQNDAKLILDSNMRCTITELFNAFPITTKEKEDLSSCPEKERSPQLAHKAMGQLNNGVAQEHKQPARIYCTQPRRISAVSVAERVAYERNEKIGQTIGYQIRLESRVTHVFVDEVHERDKFSDFLLIALRDALPRCKDLKLILIYFNNCPVVTIPGRLFDVQRYFLEDVLKITQYKTRKMAEVERELKHKLATGQSYWSQLEGESHDHAVQDQEDGGGREGAQTQARHRGRSLKVSLTITQYKTRKMAEVERELKHKLATGQSYWSQLEGESHDHAVQDQEDGGGREGAQTQARHRGRSLKVSLTITQYKTRKMVEVQRELKHKLATGQSYWSQLEGESHDHAVQDQEDGGGRKGAQTQARHRSELLVAT
ncbi:putative mrna splicing factor atp-dependent rna helicase, partial [Operophtera brumata]